MPALAVQNWWDLDLASKASAVMEAWSMAEFPEQYAPTRMWVQMFQDACDDDRDLYLADGEVVNRAEDLAGLMLPDDRVRLYRGAIPDRRFGLAWTGDLDRAKWFAKRFDGIKDGVSGKVYVADIPAEWVLAHITGRTEDEYVVDTSEIDEPEEWQG